MTAVAGGGTSGAGGCNAMKVVRQRAVIMMSRSAKASRSFAIRARAPSYTSRARLQRCRASIHRRLNERHLERLLAALGDRKLRRAIAQLLKNLRIVPRRAGRFRILERRDVLAARRHAHP